MSFLRTILLLSFVFMLQKCVVSVTEPTEAPGPPPTKSTPPSTKAPEPPTSKPTQAPPAIPPVEHTVKQTAPKSTTAEKSENPHTNDEPTTQSSAVAAPTYVSIVAIDVTSIKLQVDFTAGSYSSMELELTPVSEKILLYLVNVTGSGPGKNKEISVDKMNLTAGEEYSVRIRTSSGGKYTEWSNSSDPLRIAPATPISVEALLTDSKQISVNWKSGGGVFSGFLILVSITSTTGNKVEQNPFHYIPQDLAMTQNFTAVPNITVEEGKTYSVTVAALVGVRHSVASNPSILSTEKSDTPHTNEEPTTHSSAVAAPTKVSIVAINVTSITLQVDFTAGSYSKVELELTAVSEKILLYSANVTGSGPGKNIKISRDKMNLTAGEEYSVRIRTSSGGKYTEWSNSSQPLRIAPATPISVEALLTDSKQISVNWKSGGGVFSGFLILVSITSTTGNKVEQIPFHYIPQDLTMTQNFTAVPNITVEEEKTYSVTVAALVGVRHSVASNPSILSTAIDTAPTTKTTEAPKSTISTTPDPPLTKKTTPPSTKTTKPTTKIKPPDPSSTAAGSKADKKEGEKGPSKKINLDTNKSHFLAYFITGCVICIAGYVVFHNKKKIVAFIVEGRSGKQTKRAKGGDYKLLQSDVEEAKSNLDMSMTTKNYIY